MATKRKKQDEIDRQPSSMEADEVPFTGLVLEEVNVEAERKPQRTTARPAKAPDARKGKPARQGAGSQGRAVKVSAKAEPASTPRKTRSATPRGMQRASEDIEKAAGQVVEEHAADEQASMPEPKRKIYVQPASEILNEDPHEEMNASEFDEQDEQAGERLQKLLARAGIASRRRAEELIAEGRVQVNGQVVTEPGSRALLGRDHVRVDGKLVQAAERMRYFLLNKPKGYVTTVSDPEGRPTVMDFFKGVRERVYPVGRLDYLSEGLLLVTNDGPLANGLTRAAHGVEKRYLVKVAGDPDEATLDALRTGVVIERGRPGSGEGRVRTSPAQIRKVREGDNPWFEVVLIEGRNRELRKMFEEIGHHVEKIRRVGYGPLELDQEPGKVRELDEEELRLLRLASEGKWKPKRRREPIALPKEAGRSVRHERGSRDSRGFAGKPGSSSGPRFGQRSESRPESRPESRSGARSGPRSGPAFGSAETRPARPSWKDRGQTAGEGSRGTGVRREGTSRPDRPQFDRARQDRPRQDRPHLDRPHFDRPGAGPTRRPDQPRNDQPRHDQPWNDDKPRQDRPQWSNRPARTERPTGRAPQGGRPQRSGPSERGVGFKREGGFARQDRPARPGGPARGADRSFGTDRPARASRPTERNGAERSSGRPAAGGTGFSKPGFSKPGFSKPGFAKSGFSRPGSAKPGFSKPGFGRTGPARSSGAWRQEEEKPQPGGRNSTPRVGPDGKPREKKRWRDSFEGKSKGKPKWSGKPKSE